MNSGPNMILGCISSILWAIVNWQLLLSGIPLGMWTLLMLVGTYAIGAWIWEGLRRAAVNLRKSTSAMRKEG